MSSPRQWGPLIWSYLHLIASTFPDEPSKEAREKVVQLVNHVANFIPCGMCSGHFKSYLEQNHIWDWTKSRDKLEEYFFTFHESVNDRRGVSKELRLSLEKVRKMYREGKWDQKTSDITTADITSTKTLLEDKTYYGKVSMKDQNNTKKTILIVTAVIILIISLGIGIGILTTKKKEKKIKAF
jgi:hypothetical protein